MKNKKKTTKNWKRKLSLWAIKIGLAVVLIMLATVIYAARDIPSPKKLTTYEYPESSQIFDRNGNLLYEIYGDQNRISIKLDDIPENLKKATLAVEDVNFYKHWGFDLRGLMRGLYRTLFKNRLQGGSTITQQLVKNGVLNNRERTLSRKVKEAILTVGTEVLYSKDQILEMYFNQTPYGGTLWGAEAAAKGIFNKNAKDLTLAESALLAGLPGSPTNFNPFSKPEAAKKRQELVLNRMWEVGYISKEEMEKAKNEELKYAYGGKGILAPHFVFYIKEQLVNKYGAKRVNEGGLKVTTSLDLAVQDMAQTSVASEIAKLTKLKVTNGAALVMDPKNGQILAMVGSKDYEAEDIDGKYNVTTALRQPGSSIKPINYAVGLETGTVTAASIFYDGPNCFEVPNQKPYCPSNYGNRYFGIQTLRNSLGNSLNIAAVKMLKINGVESFIASASAMGIKTFKDPASYGLSLTLGGGEVTMVDMATAFGVFANSGIKQDPSPILKVTDRKGNVLDEYKETAGRRVLSRETSFLIHNILSDDGARSMVFGRGSKLNIKGHPEVAVKTGTTNDLRDNWTIGFTQDYVVVVWVGNNDNSKMSGVASGITGASPIWHTIMTNLMEDKQVKKPPVPAGIVSMNVCNLTGQAVPDGGCEAHFEYFNKNFQPSKAQVGRKTVLIDKTTGKVVKEGVDNPNLEWQEHTIIEDASGEVVCIDCPVVNPTPTP